MPILNGIGELNQGGFLRSLPTPNTPQFIRKYKDDPIYFGRQLVYCYNGRIHCFRETLEEVVKAEWLIQTRRKALD
jgi:hypothetical protein